MSYDHVQKAPLYLLLLIVSVVLVILPLVGPAKPPLAVVCILWGAAIVVAVLALATRYLRVRDEGDWLAVRYGPVPLLRRRITYARITAVEAGRSSVLDGWGIHYMPGRGWIYNLWGFDCAVIHIGPKIVRIGSDDVEGLVSFLKHRIGGRQQA